MREPQVDQVTIFRLVDQGFLTLDSTTGAVLGWTGPQAGITLRQLLSFTSGLPNEALCTYQTLVVLADCVDDPGAEAQATDSRSALTIAI